MLAEIKLRFGDSNEFNNIHQVVTAFNDYMDDVNWRKEQFGGEPFTAKIMVFGYHYGIPTFYDSNTHICEQMQNCEIQGIGTGISFAKKYLVSKFPSITSSTSEQQFISIVWEAVAYAYVNDPYCGGEVLVGYLARRRRPNFYYSGRVIQIIYLRIMAG
ncbi:hypothetical protein M0R45_026334 [Rubus argutus]|uniref:Uncharacterized protein n=1 Tax=Rubus argutus TaxID=59490 RepID=A0AAW1WXA3_RUBAR